MMPLHYVCGYFLRACVSLYSKVLCVIACHLCVLRKRACIEERCMCARHHGRRAPGGKLLAQLKQNAETRDRTGDLQIFGLTLSQLSYRGLTKW